MHGCSYFENDAEFYWEPVKLALAGYLKYTGSPLYRQSQVSCAKRTAEPIQMPFGMWIPVGPRNHVLDGVRGAHWRHLANTTESSVCGGDAALRQTTLTNSYICTARALGTRFGRPFVNRFALSYQTVVCLSCLCL